jgi:hypothetical protein
LRPNGRDHTEKDQSFRRQENCACFDDTPPKNDVVRVTSVISAVHGLNSWVESDCQTPLADNKLGDRTRRTLFCGFPSKFTRQMLAATHLAVLVFLGIILVEFKFDDAIGRTLDYMSSIQSSAAPPQDTPASTLSTLSTN